MEQQFQYSSEAKNTFDFSTIISIQEIQSYLSNYNITVDQAECLRDDLISILNNIINSYLAEFK